MYKLLAVLPVLAILALSGCPAGSGADVAGACQDYFDAANGCITDYGDATGTDVSTAMLSDTYCDDTYGDAVDQESVDYLDCLTDVYDSTDCSDQDAYLGIDLTSCTME